jgi:hypothetical protein
MGHNASDNTAPCASVRECSLSLELVVASLAAWRPDSQKTRNALEPLSIERVAGEWVFLEEHECSRGRVERRRRRPVMEAAVDRLQHDVSIAFAIGVHRPLDRVPDDADCRSVEAASVVTSPGFDP